MSIPNELRHANSVADCCGLDQPFLYTLVELVIAMMGAAYPEVIEGRERSVMALKNEEERFQATLDQGGLQDLV